MDHAISAGPSPEATHVRSSSSSGSITPAPSPAISLYSRGHSSRSSTSSTSMASSPLPARESFDLYASTKRLEDVHEEPQEHEDEWFQGDDENNFSGLSTFPQIKAVLTDAVHHNAQTSLYSTSPTISPLQAEYSLDDQDTWATSAPGQNQFKRQRSTDHRHSISDRFTNRFGSISRRWKTRSVIGPQLSIITYSAGVGQRSSSTSSSQMVSPALSAISKHESYLPASPVPTNLDEALHDSAVVPIYIDNGPHTPIEEEEQDEVLATTPLLPPLISDLAKKRNSPVQSPLQSPSIAASPYAIGGSRVSLEAATHSLPSPPLSHQASMASMQRSRENTCLINDIPPLYLAEDTADPWTLRLGHANFSIHPEPYVPECLDIESYREFRANWDLARKQYAQHLARTNEHYGETSKVYKLTQEKWATIDNGWKRQDTIFCSTLSPTFMRRSDSESSAMESPMSSDLLEKPTTRIVVPPMEKSGKFPEIGDADIVGPLSVAPPKAPELQRRGLQTPPDSPRKRTLFKYLSDVLGRHNNS